MKTIALLFSTFIVAILFHFDMQAQTLDVATTSISGRGYANANDFIVPLVSGIPIFDEDSCVIPAQALIPSWLGSDYGFLCDARAREKRTTPPQSVASAQAFTMAKVDGDNTQTLTIKWFFEARTFTNSLDGYAAFSENNENLNVTFNVGGLSTGTPVTVYYSYSTFAAGLTEHESVNEDSVSAANTLLIDGTDVLSGSHNFQNPPGISGWNELKDQTGVINTTAGTNVSIDVTADLFSEIQLDGKPYGFGSFVDQCVANFVGTVTLSLLPINPSGTGNVLGGGAIEFSVDIGSDSELSDPQGDGDEVFDPGDCYPFGAALLPAGGADGIKDDMTIFGTDIWPTPPDATQATAAPVGSATAYQNLYGDYFDLDGDDNLGIQLTQMQYGPGIPSIQFMSDPCIHEAQFLFISFDDDSAAHYTEPMGAVAVNSYSPFALDTFGLTARQDEIREYDFVPIYPTTWLGDFDIYDELTIHVNMPPNPDPGNPLDDDVDALDMISGSSQCPYWYFSPDHEAPGRDNTGGILNWGSVYEVQSPSGAVEVVNPVLHLGLPDSTDVDAFEFAWVWDTLAARLGLGMLFSVDDDDPITSYDESGGLDPRILYVSFLNGTHFAFYPNPLYDDIDAISTYINSLNGTPGGGTTTGMIHNEPQFASLFIQPNPLIYETNISYTLASNEWVSLELYDALGRKLQTLESGSKAKGKHTIAFNGSQLSKGIYYCRLTAGDNIISKRLVKLE